jgi:plasmid stabilization system protein ParE
MPAAGAPEPAELHVRWLPRATMPRPHRTRRRPNQGTSSGHADCFMVSMPTNRWSDKDERQYEDIKESSRERGMSERKATEIAARTVNKRRRIEGRTQNRRTMGTGNPNRPLEERTRDELYNLAQDLEIRGRGNMTKPELLEAVRHQRGR